MQALGSLIVAASSLALVSAAPAGAQQSPTPTSPATAKKVDLNEVVCEAQKVPGSRLAKAKVCHTRAEWADLRNQDRQEIDRVQTRRSMDH